MKWVGAFLALGGLGCGACPDEADFGLSVTVIDKADRQALCSATVTASEGSYHEDLQRDGCDYLGAFERAGRYVLAASQNGYVKLELRDVVVPEGVCGPTVTSATLELERAP